METISTTKRKAKKQHICNYCGLPIEIGETYELQVNINEWELYSWKLHLSCNDIASELGMYDDWDDGLTGKTFREYIQEEYRSIMHTEFNKVYESKDFSYPEFSEQLDFVKKYHNCAMVKKG